MQYFFLILKIISRRLWPRLNYDKDLHAYLFLNENFKNQCYTKAIWGSRDRSKHFLGEGRKLQHVGMHFISRGQSNLNIFCKILIVLQIWSFYNDVFCPKLTLYKGKYMLKLREIKLSESVKLQSRNQIFLPTQINHWHYYKYKLIYSAFP